MHPCDLLLWYALAHRLSRRSGVRRAAHHFRHRGAGIIGSERVNRSMQQCLNHCIIWSVPAAGAEPTTRADGVPRITIASRRP
jgi:hypothetical protein